MLGFTRERSEDLAEQRPESRPPAGSVHQAVQREGEGLHACHASRWGSCCRRAGQTDAWRTAAAVRPSPGLAAAFYPGSGGRATAVVEEPLPKAGTLDQVSQLSGAFLAFAPATVLVLG